MVDVHPAPDTAKVDGPQALLPSDFEALMVDMAGAGRRTRRDDLSAMRRVAILGTGLIGASLGMALREVGWTVSGWDPSRSARDIARQRGALHEARDTLEAAARDAQLIVLAGPLNATLATLADLDTDAIVTDVAGAKVPVIAAAPTGMRFVAGHPMAGREHAGARGRDLGAVSWGGVDRLSRRSRPRRCRSGHRNRRVGGGDPRVHVGRRARSGGCHGLASALKSLLRRW